MLYNVKSSRGSVRRQSYHSFFHTNYQRWHETLQSHLKWDFGKTDERNVARDTRWDLIYRTKRGKIWFSNKK